MRKEGSLTGINIGVVDINTALYPLVDALAGFEGAKTRTFPTYTEAEQALLQDPESVDVMVVGLGPRLEGIQFAQSLRDQLVQIPHSPRIGMIVMSGSYIETDVPIQAALQVGTIEAFITRGHLTTELVPKIVDVLGKINPEP